MTDINKAIKELRDVINGGEGWPTIHRAYDALEQQMINRYGVNNPIDCLRQLDWALTKHATGTFVNVDTYITALQKSLCASPDVVAAAWSVVKNTGPILINEGRVNEVEVYATDKDDIDNLITALEQAVGEGDLTSRIEAAAEEIEMSIEGYNIEQQKWAKERSAAQGNIIADGFIGETLLNKLNEWDCNNPMPQPRNDIAAIIRKHVEGKEA